MEFDGIILGPDMGPQWWGHKAISALSLWLSRIVE